MADELKEAIRSGTLSAVRAAVKANPEAAVDIACAAGCDKLVSTMAARQLMANQ